LIFGSRVRSSDRTDSEVFGSHELATSVDSSDRSWVPGLTPNGRESREGRDFGRSSLGAFSRLGHFVCPLGGAQIGQISSCLPSRNSTVPDSNHASSSSIIARLPHPGTCFRFISSMDQAEGSKISSSPDPATPCC